MEEGAASIAVLLDLLADDAVRSLQAVDVIPFTNGDSSWAPGSGDAPVSPLAPSPDGRKSLEHRQRPSATNQSPGTAG